MKTIQPLAAALIVCSSLLTQFGCDMGTYQSRYEQNQRDERPLADVQPTQDGDDAKTDEGENAKADSAPAG